MARPRLEPGQHGEISVSTKKNAKLSIELSCTTWSPSIRFWRARHRRGRAGSLGPSPIPNSLPSSQQPARAGGRLESWAPAVRGARWHTIRVGRWMGDDEFAKMTNSGRVVEGGGGRTYVMNPANPDAYPAGKGIYVEFNVPRDSVVPAS